MAEQLISETESLCPECLRKIPARRISREGNVYLQKTCPYHGDYEALLWRNAQSFSDWAQYEEETVNPCKTTLTQLDRGCPHDCGICPQHKADTCVAVLEVTNRCNLHCPICFAASGENPAHDIPLKLIKQMYENIIECNWDYSTIQISGGEPTIRDDLPDIIALGRTMGFNQILVNSNGVRLAKDKQYFRRLKESGATGVFFQFDGISDDVYLSLRGEKLFDLKCQVLANATELQIGVILVPVLVPKVNDHKLGDIVQFAKKWMPTVKAIHFQPVSYFGRYPKPPRDEDRITIPDVLDALESQTKGEIKRLDFAPRRRKDSHCSFGGGFVLQEDNQLVPVTEYPTEPRCSCQGTPAESVHRFISRRWRWAEEPEQLPSVYHYDADSWENFFERARTHYLSISGMPFQDVWNIDLQRLQGCCVHVATPDGRLIPHCAFHLTSATGERLHTEYGRAVYVSGRVDS